MDPQKITKEARDAILINRLDKDYKLDSLFAQEGNTSHNRNARTPIPAPEIERNNKEKAGKERQKSGKAKNDKKKAPEQYSGAFTWAHDDF